MPVPLAAVSACANELLRVTVLPNRNGSLPAQSFPVSPHHPVDAVTAFVMLFAATLSFGP
jgi:hypothetical protein